MIKKTLIFFYGRRQAAYDPPQTSERHHADEVRGEMWDRDNDPSMINIGSHYSPWVHGEVHVVHAAELPALDRSESGFRRRTTVTRSGVRVWIYEWMGPVPSGKVNLTRWKPK